MDKKIPSSHFKLVNSTTYFVIVLSHIQRTFGFSKLFNDRFVEWHIFHINVQTILCLVKLGDLLCILSFDFQY
jgi:hypothetical protein